MKTNNIIIAAFMLVLSAAGARAAVACAPGADKEITAGSAVNVKGVDRIENRSAVVVHYTQGSQSTVRVVESGKYPSRVRVRGNALVVDLPPETNNDRVYGNEWGNTTVIGGSGTRVKTDIYITLPQLSEVYNMSSMTLEMGALKGAGFPLKVKNSGSMGMKMTTVNTTAGSVEMNNYGSLRVSATSISAGSLEVYNSGSLTFDVPSVSTSGDQKFKNSGALTLKMPQSKASELYMNNYGSLNMDGDMAATCGSFGLYNSGSQSKGATIKVSAATASVKNSGVLSDNVEVRSQGGDGSITVNDYGVMKNSVKFTGGTADFYSSGSTNIDAEVHCSKLNIRKSGGVGVIKVRGTAGELSMGGTDQKNINVEKLHAGKTSEMYFNGNATRVYGNGTRQNVKTNGNGGVVNQYNP